MNKESFIECERKRFAKLIKFRLPNKFLRIGIAIVGLSMIGMVVRGFFSCK